MPIRRFKTMLLSQNKQYGISSGKTSSSVSSSGGSVSQSGGYTVHTFSYTGSDQEFLLFGSSFVEFILWGAAGAGANAEGYSDPGGPGGFATGTFNLNSGNYVIQVGQGGLQATSSGTVRPSRPYPNAGLPSLRNGYISGSGGGRSAIFSSSFSSQNTMIVAGGGGGAGGHGGGASAQGGHGGSGGGTNGGAGVSPNYTEVSNGATQSSGGVTDSGSGRVSGQFAGADAGNGTQWSSGWNAAGGGGDGWYGGGAVNNKHHGGGGGSGYLSSEAISGSLESTAPQDSRYSSAVLPPQSGNQYYQSGIARGNINANGGNGLVVIRYLNKNYFYD